MHSQPNPPELPEPGSPILLPANVTTVMAEDLRVRLVFAADQDEEIIIDAAETESLGQAGLQLLVAARREAERLDLPFAIVNLREPLRARISALGLTEALAPLPTDYSAQEDISR